MLSKETKELDRVLRQGNIKEIKHVFGKSSEPLRQKDVVKVLRLLLGRSNFDFEMVQLLKKHHCDLNAPLGDEKSNPEQYRMGDYLSSYGRLSPRLIDEMAKAGYDFSKTNAKGEHAGFYLLGTRSLNARVVAALKAQGVDFDLKNKSGKTVADCIVDNIATFSSKMLLSKPKRVIIAKLSPLFEIREDFIRLSTVDGNDLKGMIADRLREIKPERNETVGIQSILSQNRACYNLAYYAQRFVQEKVNIEKDMRTRFEKSCPLFMKKLSDLSQNEHC
ncbi:MAG: hypothetical protein IJY92_05380 [Alphaproteobacteria bacterium]|nr:hypothetical protein [Alphaproteobacteria bacterium]